MSESPHVPLYAQSHSLSTLARVCEACAPLGTVAVVAIGGVVGLFLHPPGPWAQHEEGEPS